MRANGSQEHEQQEVFLGTKEFSLDELLDLIAEKLHISSKLKK